MKTHTPFLKGANIIAQINDLFMSFDKSFFVINNLSV